MGQKAPVNYGGPVMCCVTATDGDAVQFCKDYIAKHEYTRDKVKIVQKERMTLVIAIAKLW